MTILTIDTRIIDIYNVDKINIKYIDIIKGDVCEKN